MDMKAFSKIYTLRPTFLFTFASCYKQNLSLEDKVQKIPNQFLCKVEKNILKFHLTGSCLGTRQLFPESYQK